MSADLFLDEVSTLFDVAKRCPEIAKRLIDLIHSGREFLGVEVHPAAAGTGDCVALPKLGDGGRELLAAARAWQRDGVLVEDRHGASPVGSGPAGEVAAGGEIPAAAPSSIGNSEIKP